MKAIMISIKPKYAAKILNGEKTIEIRKSMPKCELPIDVYIYCTKQDNLCCIRKVAHNDRYICGKDFNIKDFPRLSSGYDGKGKVVAKFTLNKVDTIWWTPKEENPKDLFTKSCLSKNEIESYLNGNIGYAWHISNLEIFDKPKELNEFKHLKPSICGVKDDKGLYQCDKCKYGYSEFMYCECRLPLTKAPQSFAYIEIDQSTSKLGLCGNMGINY